MNIDSNLKNICGWYQFYVSGHLGVYFLYPLIVLFGELKEVKATSIMHGVSLRNHEEPNITEVSNEILEENMVITIEPGIYIEGVGGYRHSDTILVTFYLVCSMCWLL